MSSPRVRRRRWPWIVLAAVVVLLVPVAILAVPILTHQNQGSANQEAPVDEFPLEVSATGDDGRTRDMMVLSPEAGGTIDTSALEVGQRLIVSGSGYDSSRGIYVAICVIPDDPSVKPGPCVGGVPDQEQTDVAAGTVQYAPSNWINDDWAWKLFGARSYDDLAAGTFTAYLEVGDPAGDGFDCRVDRCAIYSRNDHTALNDRVQDLYIPIRYAD
ncbi:hypothetical protein [Antiquaquibacter soli]|uniref:Uncharacterized protein n=1 Tax=Antiquaquibacter soli TaxID=3064523 RepID=A0ABT9BPL5_9MICO|nr:hypothetical protein [Protaetiibacter sp. WY-16]MDO7882977.1 hypothetical protein [Protaetiibacter sp. WY-16]